ncbi:MAG: hypothetical protein V5A55_10850 [Halovenus sp.]
MSNMLGAPKNGGPFVGSVDGNIPVAEAEPLVLGASVENGGCGNRRPDGRAVGRGPARDGRSVGLEGGDSTGRELSRRLSKSTHPHGTVGAIGDDEEFAKVTVDTAAAAVQTSCRQVVKPNRELERRGEVVCDPTRRVAAPEPGGGDGDDV